MDGLQLEPQNSNSLWQAALAVAVFCTLSFLMVGENPVSASLKTAQANQNDPSRNESNHSQSDSTHAVQAQKNQRSAAPIAPSPRRAMMQIQSSSEVQKLLKDPKNKLVETETVEGLGVWTMKYQHTHNGIEVLGSMTTYHSGPAGEKIRNHLKDVQIQTDPKLSVNEAEKRAIENVGRNSRTSGTPELKILPSQNPQSAKLIYTVQLRDANSLPHEVWIDANSGKIISHMARTGETRETQGKGTL